MSSLTFQETPLDANPTPKLPVPGYFSRVERIEKFLYAFYQKITPSLPRSAQDKLLSSAPYIAIMLVIFYFPFSLLNLFGVLGNFDWRLLVASVASLAGIFLTSLSVPGLFKRYFGAWKLNFYASLWVVLTLIQAQSLTALVWKIGLLGLCWYVLFRLRPRYRH